ncbi:MAG: hypothetical protein AB1558_15980 [Thermodesulfobacteriota bacterium]
MPVHRLRGERRQLTLAWSRFLGSWVEAIAAGTIVGAIVKS